MGIWTKGQTYSCFIQGAQRDPGHGDEPGENVSLTLTKSWGWETQRLLYIIRGAIKNGKSWDFVPSSKH